MQGAWISLSDVAYGRVRFEGAPGFDVCNPHGTVHGGWYGTLLDSAMACAFLTTLSDSSGYTTLEYKVNITRGIPLDTPVIAEGVVQHAGRRTGCRHGKYCRERQRSTICDRVHDMHRAKP